MNKIMLVAEGNYNTDVLVNALQKMILDPDKETVQVIDGKDMHYEVRGPLGSSITEERITNIFIGQIVKKSNKKMPCIVNRKKTDFWYGGYIDLDQALEAENIKKEVPLDSLNEEIKNDPNLFLKYLLNNYGIGDVRYLLNGVDSYIVKLNTKKGRRALYCITTGKTVLFTSKERFDVEYWCNSKEVLDYLGVEYYSEKNADIASLYTPYGGYEHGCSYTSNEDLERATFVSARDNAISEFKKSLLLVTDKKVKQELIRKFKQIESIDSKTSKCSNVKVYKFDNSKNK